MDANAAGSRVLSGMAKQHKSTLTQVNLTNQVQVQKLKEANAAQERDHLAHMTAMKDKVQKLQAARPSGWRGTQQEGHRVLREQADHLLEGRGGPLEAAPRRGEAAKGFFCRRSCMR